VLAVAAAAEALTAAEDATGDNPDVVVVDCATASPMQSTKVVHFRVIDPIEM
jgi:hypothetical protein